MEIKGNKWLGAAVIVFTLFEIIVSAGAINATWAFAKLNAIDPVQFSKNGIYAVMGCINLILVGLLDWRVFKAIMKD